MRRFIFYSRTGSTAPFLGSLRENGRLDTVYQCILTSLFDSHAIRRDVEFHAFLYGAPNPPLHLKIDGGQLHDVRVDEATWTNLLNGIFAGKPHPGMNLSKEGIEPFSRSITEKYVLSEKGENINGIIMNDPTFFVGDHVGLPKKFEDLLIKEGAKKVSIGRNRYLAASTIDIVNYILDQRAYSK
jgi:tRNA pseudouridine-54 N-methylase